MDTKKLTKLRRIFKTASVMPYQNYTELPLMAVQMLLYLALNGTDRYVYVGELTAEFCTNEAKIYRACREHLSNYIASVRTVKEGVKSPVKAFRLTRAGEEYITEMCNQLDN